MSQLPHDDKRERSPLESAKVVIEHYNRIIETIDEHRLVLDRQEADFVMTVEDYQTLRDFACRNDAPPQAINLEGVDGDEMDKSADRAALLTRLMAAGEPRETTPSHALRKLLDTDPFCPSCGHNRDKSSVSSIDNEDGTRSCQMCGTRWQETEFAPSTTPHIPAYYIAVHTGGEPYNEFDFPVADNIGFKLSPNGAWMRAHDVMKAFAASAIGQKTAALLKAAKCPACDGSGNIPHQIGDYEWEAEQCQWCAEVAELLHSSDGGKVP